MWTERPGKLATQFPIRLPPVWCRAPVAGVGWGVTPSGCHAPSDASSTPRRHAPVSRRRRRSRHRRVSHGAACGTRTGSPRCRVAFGRSQLEELIAIQTAPSGGQLRRATSSRAPRLSDAGSPADHVQLAVPVTGIRTWGRRSPAAIRPCAAWPTATSSRRSPPTSRSIRSPCTSATGGTMEERDDRQHGRAALLVAWMTRWKHEGLRDLVPILKNKETSAEGGIRQLSEPVPVEGVSGPPPDASHGRAHCGAHDCDERRRVRRFNDAREFWYRLVPRLAGRVPRA